MRRLRIPVPASPAREAATKVVQPCSFRRPQTVSTTSCGHGMKLRRVFSAAKHGSRGSTRQLPRAGWRLLSKRGEGIAQPMPLGSRCFRVRARDRDTFHTFSARSSGRPPLHRACPPGSRRETLAEETQHSSDMVSGMQRVTFSGGPRRPSRARCRCCPSRWCLPGVGAA